MGALKLVYGLLLLSWCLTIVYTSHFRGGLITWAPVYNQPNKVCWWYYTSQCVGWITLPKFIIRLFKRHHKSRKDAASKSSLKYLNINACQIGTTHPSWDTDQISVMFIESPSKQIFSLEPTTFRETELVSKNSILTQHVCFVKEQPWGRMWKRVSR